MPEPHNRREFVRVLAWGASAGSLLAPAATRADDEEDRAREAEVDARMALVLARFGKHLDADARRAVRAELGGIVRRAEALRKFPLDNGDGPFPVFTPYRAPLA